ncbi:MAG: hypothetical protein AAF541_04745 [Pseudomonadota bacterium]
MEYTIMITAMALDTLPSVGRVFLLAGLLATALYGVTRFSSVRKDIRTAILFRKGALASLILVPVGVYITSIRMPVYVDEVARFNAVFPEFAAYLVVTIWLIVALYLSYRLRAGVREMQQIQMDQEVPEKLVKRLAHWKKRLGLQGKVDLCVAGGEHPWHTSLSYFARRYLVVLPAAARNWPMGIVDVCLLTQLAQIKNNDWEWVLFGRWVALVYWPLPWMHRLVGEFARDVVAPSQDLAGSAYRDPVGWQRDLKQASQRLETLKSPLDFEPESNRLRALYTPEPDASPDLMEEFDPEDFATRREISKARLRKKHHDPHEKAYWLIATACVVVGVASTLTIVKAPPEFEPKFLNIKWQDQMARRLKDYTDESGPENSGAGSDGATGSADNDGQQ